MVSEHVEVRFVTPRLRVGTSRISMVITEKFCGLGDADTSLRPHRIAALLDAMPLACETQRHEPEAQR